MCVCMCVCVYVCMYIQAASEHRAVLTTHSWLPCTDHQSHVDEGTCTSQHAQCQGVVEACFNRRSHSNTKARHMLLLRMHVCVRERVCVWMGVGCACMLLVCAKRLCPYQTPIRIVNMLHTHAHVCGLVAGADSKSHAGELFAAVV
jgi:hypothetical protein